MTQFKEKNIIIPYDKIQSCKVSPGLLHPVLSAFAQTVALIVIPGPESCTIVHRPGRAKDAGGSAASNYYRERASPNEGEPAA